MFISATVNGTNPKEKKRRTINLNIRNIMYYEMVDANFCYITLINGEAFTLYDPLPSDFVLMLEELT